MRCFFLGIAAAATLLAQQQPETQELLDALARTAALFSRTAPSLGAKEKLIQRARRGDMQILKRGKNEQLREVSFSLPENFENHEVVSDYTMGSTAPGSGFHEIRKTLTIDHVAPPPDQPARHAMTLNVEDADDDTKKKLLENLEFERLQGAATDFGPILLLFTAAHQRDLRFTSGGRHTRAPGPGWVLNFRQTTGRGAVTEFRNSRELRHMPEGQIWFREDDLMPLRIILNSDEIITPKFTLRNEAEVDYQPTPYGLAPRSVIHRQFLNEDLLVENVFTYSEYRGIEIVP